MRRALISLAVVATLLTSACEAQMGHGQASSGKSAVAAVPGAVGSSSASQAKQGELSNEAPFSEPAITGKIVDAVTQQPIAGAFVYGFYATYGGGTLAGGSKMGQHVKSFLAVTDGNGVYRLESWSTGNQPISGTRGTKFPMMAIYKPGYDLWFDQMSTIAQYRPKSGVAGTEVEIRDGVRDWTKYPHRLVPLSKEQDRYAALSNSSYPMMMAGECGWEVYAPLLLAQHNELKDWYKRNAPSGYLKADGYPNGAMARPPEFQRIDMSFESAVDSLIRMSKSNGAIQKCKDPRQVFIGKQN